ncbi:MAG: glycosyltransferase family 4 protein [Polyangiaceae bacterium]
MTRDSPDVLLDLTPLDTPSRYRGIGRYARELGRAFAVLPACDLRIGGLVGAWGKRAVLDTTLYDGRSDLKPTARSFRWMLQKRRFALPPVVNRSGARLVHITEATGTPLGMRIPRVVTCHDLIPLIFYREYLGRGRHHYLIRLAKEQHRYRGARRVIAISDATKRDLIEHIKIPADRIDVVHHGIDHERFQPRAEATDDALVRKVGVGERPYILCIGGGDRRKNLTHLVEAFAASGVAREVDLVFVGLLGNAEPKLRAAARRHQVADQTRFLGYVDEESIPALYRRSLLHAFPTLYEGFGFPAVEAMACGAPTLTTPHAALGEVTGNATELVQGTVVDETAAALKRLADDAELRSQLRSAGLAVAARFSWAECAAKTLESYRRALADV